jgi:hypothetical protein
VQPSDDAWNFAAHERQMMSMVSPHLIRLSAVIVMSLGLASCGRTESYRYKLTLAVNTPDGVKRGSSVGELQFFDVSIPARGTMSKLSGEALYLDLGPGRRPLIALLTSQLHPKDPREGHWSRDGGPNENLLSQLYGVSLSASLLAYVSKIARMRGAHEITTNDLPDLVTFADINNPKSVIEVDPNDLQATLGAGISWNEMTLEITDEPITKGIELKLTWIPAYHQGMLDGERYSARTTLANTLSTADFQYLH